MEEKRLETVSLDFEQFYRKFYSKSVSYTARKVNNSQAAEDIVCESFCYCYEHFSEYDPSKASYGTWLFVILNSRIKNYYRDKKESVDLDALDGVLFDDRGTCMDEALEIEEMRGYLAESLKQLNIVQRKLVILRYFYNYDTNALAIETGLTPGAARTALSRALKKLEMLMKDHYKEKD